MEECCSKALVIVTAGVEYYLHKAVPSVDYVQPQDIVGKRSISDHTTHKKLATSKL